MHGSQGEHRHAEGKCRGDPCGRPATLRFTQHLGPRSRSLASIGITITGSIGKRVLGNRLVLPNIFVNNSTATFSQFLFSLLHTPLDSPKRLSSQHTAALGKSLYC